jgi:hypothetical protein
MRTLVTGAPTLRAKLVEATLERVEALPGVVSSGTIQSLPLTGFTNHGPFHFVGRPLPADPSLMESDVSTVSRGYFTAAGMELLRGRPFGSQDQIDSPASPACGTSARAMWRRNDAAYATQPQRKSVENK